jgi:hypothetical protein
MVVLIDVQGFGRSDDQRAEWRVFELGIVTYVRPLE